MNKTKCNICGYPAEVTYTEQDHETGKTRICRHTVDCPGHIGIHPALWNRAGGNSSGGVRSISYDEFEKYYTTLAKERPHVEKDRTGIEDFGLRKDKKRKKPKPRNYRNQKQGEKRVFSNRQRQSR